MSTETATAPPASVDSQTLDQIKSLILTPCDAANGGLLKLDLGCGQNKLAGYHGVDKFACEGVDTVHDLLSYPWPFEDSSVGEVHSSHFFEHVPAFERPKFMDELWRVMAHKGRAVLITPWYMSARATQDFTHQWPPISESSYLYFNKGWRELNKLTHGYYDMRCDFDCTQFAHSWDNNWSVKHEQARMYANAHYFNCILDLIVTLTCRKEPAA